MKLVGYSLGISSLLLFLAACGEDPPVTGGTGGSSGTATGGGGSGGKAGSTAGGGMAGTPAAGGTMAGGGAGGAPGGAGGGGAGGASGGGAGGTGGAACDTKLGKAMKFAGVVDMMAGDLGADATFNDGPRTVELWAKFSGESSWTAERSILEIGKPDGGDHVWGIDMSGRDGTGGRFGPYTNCGCPSDHNGGGGILLADTAANVGWLHLSWGYAGTGGKQQFTVNGVELPAAARTGFTLTTSPGYVLLGASQNFGNDGWDGIMDEVRIWNVLRTPAEILANMKVIQKPTTAGLVAYYQFSEGTGGDVGDSTGKATHKLSACTAASGACPAANAAAPTWVDSDIPGPFTCAP